MRNLIIAVCGAVTTATALLFDHLLDLNLMGAFVGRVIPAGAVALGGVAGAGYIIGSRLTNRRVDRTMLVYVIGTVLVALIGFHYVQYMAEIVEGRRVAKSISFGRYMNITANNMVMKTRGSSDGSEPYRLGGLGYGVYLLEFLGFMAGTGIAYLATMWSGYCDACSRYHQRLAKKVTYFRKEADFQQYYGAYDHGISTEQYEHILAYESPSRRHASIRQITNVIGCPDCGTQSVEDAVEVKKRLRWRDVPDLGRTVDMPKGYDMRKVYATARAERA